MKIKTNILSFAFCLFCITISTNSFAQWQGSGTYSNPYQIYTFNDMKALADYVNSNGVTDNKYWKLMNDIDFNFDTTFIRIGVYTETSFSGIFDGNNKIISNFRMYHPNSGGGNVSSLFGINDGTIKNLGVINANILSSGIANVICCANNGQIENCFATGIVQAATYSSGICFGNGEHGLIRGCYTDVDIQEGQYAAGFCAETFSSDQGVAIFNSYSIGDVYPTNNAAPFAQDIGGYDHNYNKYCYYREQNRTYTPWPGYTSVGRHIKDYCTIAISCFY